MNQIFKFKHLKLTKTVGVYKALACFRFSVGLNSSESRWLSKARRIDKWHKSNSYIPFTSEPTPREMRTNNQGASTYAGTIWIVNSFFPPYSRIVLFNTRYLVNRKEARTMASASARPWSWPRRLPWFDPMAPLRGRPQRCTERHKAQLTRLKIGRSRCIIDPAAAPSTASTVQATRSRTVIIIIIVLVPGGGHKRIFTPSLKKNNVSLVPHTLREAPPKTRISPLRPPWPCQMTIFCR